MVKRYVGGLLMDAFGLIGVLSPKLEKKAHLTQAFVHLGLDLARVFNYFRAQCWGVAKW